MRVETERSIPASRIYDGSSKGNHRIGIVTGRCKAELACILVPVLCMLVVCI